MLTVILINQYYRNFLKIFVTTFIGVLVGSILKAIFAFYKERKRLHKLAESIPGPKAYPIFGNALEIIRCPHELHDKVLEFSKLYGSPMRFWLGSQLNILISKPDHIERVLMSRKTMIKGPTYKFIQKYLGDGLLGGSGKLWRNQRRHVLPTFKLKILENQTDIFLKHSLVLVKKLAPLANQQKFNVIDKVALCLHDVVFETLFGIKLAEPQSEKYLNFMHYEEKSYEVVYTRMTHLWYQNDFLYSFSKLAKEEKVCKEFIDEFKNMIISTKLQHFDISGQQPTSLDKLLEMPDLTLEELKNVAYTLYTASQEATSTIISFAILMLAIHKNVQKKVHEEIDAVLLGGDDELTAKDLHRMKYLNMCIDETLRLFPIGNVIQRQIQEDFQLSKEFLIPAGSSIIIAIYAVQRDPDIWKEPDKFIPERFAPEAIAERHPYSYVPFSAGPMNCIGQKYALMAIRAITASVLQHYEVDTEFTNISDLKLKGDVSVRPQNGYPVTLRPRVRQ